jgi:hypothetical protein
MSRHWEEMEGEVEAWICPTCGGCYHDEDDEGCEKDFHRNSSTDG